MRIRLGVSLAGVALGHQAAQRNHKGYPVLVLLEVWVYGSTVPPQRFRLAQSSLSG